MNVEKRPADQLAPRFPEADACPAWLRDWVHEQYPAISYEPLTDLGLGNALTTAWHGVSFLFPPLAEAEAFVQKACFEQRRGNFSILVVPAMFNSIYWLV